MPAYEDRLVGRLGLKTWFYAPVVHWYRAIH